MPSVKSRLRPAWHIVRGIRTPSRLPKAVRAEARAIRWSRLNEGEVTVETDFGRMTLRTGCEDSIGRSLYVYGSYELDFMDAALGFLRQTGRLGLPGHGTLLDVGANNGVTTLGMLTRDQMERSVTIEPEPLNFDLLQRNIQQNGLGQRVWAMQAAAAHQASTLEFELSATNFGDHRIRVKAGAGAPELFDEGRRSTIEVAGRPVDEIVAELPVAFRDLALVWIDVQGFEASVLRGGSRLWSTGIPVVSEVWPYGLRRAGTSRDELAAIVREHWSGFAVEGSRGFVEHPIADFGPFFDDLDERAVFTNVVYLK